MHDGAWPGLEVITLNKPGRRPRRRYGPAGEARQRARQAGQRLWLSTGNDNVQAIGFYQRRGMDLVALHRDFADEGEADQAVAAGEPDGEIVFRHAIELEFPAPGDQ